MTNYEDMIAGLRANAHLSVAVGSVLVVVLWAAERIAQAIESHNTLEIEEPEEE